MSNAAGIHVKGPRVLVKPIAVEKVTKAGIILTDSLTEREEYMQVSAVVIDISSNAWFDEPTPWAAVGDTVLMPKNAGLIYKGNDGATYRVIRDIDVVAVVEKVDG